MRRGRRGVGMIAVDLFAGPGGWDVAAASLGIDALGIEWDAAACRVREAAGHRTLQADVADLDPHDFPCDLLIASPPCTAFSMAGKGEGRKVLDELVGAMYDLGKSEANSWQTHGPYPLSTDDETARLVLEPLRWALAIRPRMVACEQVPPVLPLWEAMAQVLRAEGYHAWTGILSAERFGVPQTRKRAFLIASLDGPVGEPLATHQRYVAPLRRDDIGAGLFDLPDPERIVARGEDNLLPWVSMAEALGWGMTGRPYPAVACSSTTGGPDKEKVGGSEARARIYEEALSGRWIDGENPDQQRDNIPEHRRIAAMRAGAQDKSTVRSVDEPAPTITGGNDYGERVWLPESYNSRDQRDGRTGEPNRQRGVEPAPTISGESRNDSWTFDRPATTVQADARIWPPGHKLNADDTAAGREYEGRAGENAIRVTIEEAATLQSFPDDYPWGEAGTRTAAFQCIGNAVPPLMARGVLQAVVR